MTTEAIDNIRNIREASIEQIEGINGRDGILFLYLSNRRSSVEQDLATLRSSELSQLSVVQKLESILCLPVVQWL